MEVICCLDFTAKTEIIVVTGKAALGGRRRQRFGRQDKAQNQRQKNNENASPVHTEKITAPFANLLFKYVHDLHYCKQSQTDAAGQKEPGIIFMNEVVNFSAAMQEQAAYSVHNQKAYGKEMR